MSERYLKNMFDKLFLIVFLEGEKFDQTEKSYKSNQVSENFNRLKLFHCYSVILKSKVLKDLKNYFEKKIG